MSITTTPPIKSPFLAEYGPALLTDESGNVLPVLGVVFPDSSGHSGLVVTDQVGETSQVTARQQAPLIGDSLIPTIALVGLDTDGNPIPIGAALAAAAASGKFQSAVTVATGSAQNVAHGLGVIPSLVLIAPYDNTASGSTPFTFQIAEGTHTTTNVVLTATSGLKFKVIAFA